MLLKAGTSIGANIREAEFARFRADFISKMSIALKEAAETEYWIMLMRETGYISDEVSAYVLSFNLWGLNAINYIKFNTYPHSQEYLFNAGTF